MKNIRYEYLIDSIHIIKPKKIVEIGIAQGLRSYQMIKEAKIFHKKIQFFGYDVFDTKDENFHKMVGNGKKVSSRNEVENFLQPLNVNIEMFPGMTKETLWGNNVTADLVFIDGDHRIEAIQSDYEAVKNTKVVVFDDYYISGEHSSFTIDEYGCNQLIDKLPDNEVFISPKTSKFPDIRIAFWSKNKDIIIELNETFC